MFSVEGEKIDFVEPINPLGKQVEDWMGLVEEQMKISVKNSLLKSLEDYKLRPREQWALVQPGQCVLNGSQILWTFQVEKFLKEK